LELPPIEDETVVRVLEWFADAEEIRDGIEAAFGGSFYALRDSAADAVDQPPRSPTDGVNVDVLHCAVALPIEYDVGPWRLCTQFLDPAWQHAGRRLVRAYHDNDDLLRLPAYPSHALSVADLARAGYLRPEHLSDDVRRALEGLRSGSIYREDVGREAAKAQLLQPVRWFPDGSVRFFVFYHRTLARMVADSE
jgi:hypothetical protein